MSRGRWITAALIASVALNLFFAAIAGVGWSRGWHRGALGPDPISAGWWQRGAEAATVERVWERNREAMRARVGELRGARRDMAQFLAADPFDDAAFAAALERLRGAHARVQTEMHKGFAEFVAELDAAQRRELAERMQRRPKRGPQSNDQR